MDPIQSRTNLARVDNLQAQRVHYSKPVGDDNRGWWGLL
jgi:hypothetical protein